MVTFKFTSALCSQASLGPLQLKHPHDSRELVRSQEKDHPSHGPSRHRHGSTTTLRNSIATRTGTVDIGYHPFIGVWNVATITYLSKPSQCDSTSSNIPPVKREFGELTLEQGQFDVEDDLFMFSELELQGGCLQRQ